MQRARPRRRPVRLLALLGLVAGALCLSGGPGAPRPAGPPGLLLERETVTLGRLRPGAEREVGLAWRRVGAGPLRVLQARTDCGCALLEPLPPVLPAGAAGELRVRLRVGERPGPLRHRVRIVTDGPPGRDVLDLWLQGYVRTDVALRPLRLDLPPGPPGSELRRVVEVLWDGAVPAPAGASGPRARLVGLPGRVDLVPALRPGWDGAQLVVTLRRPRRPGPFQAWLRVDLGARGPRTVPIRGRVTRAAAGPGEGRGRPRR